MKNKVAEVVWLPAKGCWRNEDGVSMVKTLSDNYKYYSWDDAQTIAHQLNHETRDSMGHYDVVLTDAEKERRQDEKI
jgi:hypothetical protein